MAYRNKTFVSFASEDISYYRLMTAWVSNEHIDFNFYDAHDFYLAMDDSKEETIRRRIRERLANTKQVVLLVGDKTKKKAADSESFIYYEMRVIKNLKLPVVIANVNASREPYTNRIPTAMLEPYTISVSFQPKIIQYALDHFPVDFGENLKSKSPKEGPYFYKPSVYHKLGLCG